MSAQTKKKRKQFKKRKLFTFQFRGRKRRALLWRKETYELWFLYAKVHQANGGKIPKAFGNLQEFKSFEEWWRHPKFGFELFCEPYVESAAQVVAGKVKLNSDEVLLKINVNTDEDILKRDIEIALRQFSAEHLEYQSRARFQPSVPPKGLKLKKLREALDAFVLSEKMIQRRAIRRLYKRSAFEDPVFERVTRFRTVLNKSVRLDDRSFLREKVPYRALQMTDESKRRYEFWCTRKMRQLGYARRVVKDAFISIEKGTFP